MATILYPLFIAIIGALIYAFASAKPAELGRILFFVGAFWTVWLLTGKQFHFPG